MSGGLLRVEGQVLPKRYSSRQPADAYLAEVSGAQGKFGLFNLEILEQADRDADFGRFDNDGPDGLPNSGDDDGYVDIVFINLLTVPKDFLVSTATGLASLGLDTDYISDDPAAGGGYVRIRSRFTGFGGTTQRGHVFSVTAATMCHEFGHIMGLVDLFDQSSVTANGELDPEEDSAGIGKWGLMGLGTLGWGVEDGPNAFSAWSLAKLGWVEVVEIRESVRDLVVEDAIKEKRIYKIPLSDEEYFLLENRQASGSYYNRNVPASGLLIWHVDERADNDEERHKRVDLVCADGLFADRGYPGETPDPVAGRDNLDFWSRDASYATAHNGNQGDATDPFDGVRFKRFAWDTNPVLSAHTGYERGLPMGIAVENIRADGERMVIDVLVRQSLDRHITDEETWSGKVDVIGDVVVEPGAKLTVEAGTQVRFGSFDWDRTGFDPGNCELLVFGDIEFQGTAENPVTFSGSRQGGRWGGIYLMDGQAPVLDAVEIDGAWQGVVRLRLPPGQTRWTGVQQIPMDLVVPADAELVVEPGTVVQFTDDSGRRGVAPEFTELIVDGRLRVEGEAGQPVRFTADPLISDAIWYGVRLSPGGRADARFMRIERAGYGFSGRVTAHGRLRIVDSRIGDGAAGGLRLTVDERAEVARTLFTRNPGQAVRVEGSGRLVLDGVTIQENGQEGIFLGNASLAATDLLLEQSGILDPEDPRSGLKGVGGRAQKIELHGATIADNAVDGLELDEWEGLLELDGGEIRGNSGAGVSAGRSEWIGLDGTSIEGNLQDGMAVTGGKVDIRGGSFAANVETGLVLDGGAVGRVEQNLFKDGKGVRVEGVEDLIVRFCRFENTPLGLDLRDSSPIVEANRFAANDRGVQVRGTRIPKSLTRNVFTGNPIALENLATEQLQATHNYWGTVNSVEVASLIVGPVAWIPFLMSEAEATAIGGADGLPGRFALHAAYPNPFNGQVAIPFEIAASGMCELEVYDALGQPVRRLIDARLEPGAYRVTWDGRDEEGRVAGSGVYLVQVRVGGEIGVRRVVLVQ